MLSRSLSSFQTQYSKLPSLGNVVLSAMATLTASTYVGLLVYRFVKTRSPEFRAKEEQTLRRASSFITAFRERCHDDDSKKEAAAAVSTSRSLLVVNSRNDIFHEYAHCYSVLAENNMASWRRDRSVLQLRQLAHESLCASVDSIFSPSCCGQHEAVGGRSRSVADRSGEQQHKLYRLLQSAKLHNVSIGWRLQLQEQLLFAKLQLRGIGRTVRLLCHLVRNSALPEHQQQTHSDSGVMEILSQQQQQQQQQQQDQGEEAAGGTEHQASPSADTAIAATEAAVSKVEQLQEDSSLQGTGARSFIERCVGAITGLVTVNFSIHRIQERYGILARVATLAGLEATRCAVLRYTRLRHGTEKGYTSVQLMGNGGPGLPLAMEILATMLYEVITRFAYATDLQISRLFSRQAAYSFAMADTAAITAYSVEEARGARGGHGGSSAAGYTKVLEEVRETGNSAVFCVSGLVQLSVQLGFVCFDVCHAIWTARKSKSSMRTTALCLGISFFWYFVDDGLLVWLTKKIFETPRKIMNQLAHDMAKQNQQHQHHGAGTTSEQQQKQKQQNSLSYAFNNPDVDTVVTLDDGEKAILSDQHAVDTNAPALSLNKQPHDSPIPDETVLSLRVMGLEVVATLCGLQHRHRAKLRDLVRDTGSQLLDPHDNIVGEMFTLVRRNIAFHVASWYLSSSLPSSSTESAAPLRQIRSCIMDSFHQIRTGHGADVARAALANTQNAAAQITATVREIANSEPSLVVGGERWVDRVQYFLSSLDDLDTKLDARNYFLNLERFSVIVSSLVADATIDKKCSSSDINFFQKLTGNSSTTALSLDFRNVSFDYFPASAGASGSDSRVLAGLSEQSDRTQEEERNNTFGSMERYQFSISSSNDAGGDENDEMTMVEKTKAGQSSKTDPPPPPPARGPALNNLNFKIRAGEILGVIGTSGVGKSTLLRLILRIYDPTSGSIMVGSKNSSSSSGEGEVDLASIQDVRAWRRNAIAYVDQHPLICNDATVRENVEFGRPLPREVVDQALRDACCSGFVQRLKRGADSVVGFRLSSGERQRLAIARAFARRAPLLLLDEGTSCLDAETESAVIRGCVGRYYSSSSSSSSCCCCSSSATAAAAAAQKDSDTSSVSQQLLLPLSPTTTTIIVAHRLATLKIAHRILVLDGSSGAGNVVGLGTHEELMASCEQYRQVYNRQCILRGLGGAVEDGDGEEVEAATAKTEVARDVEILRSALVQWDDGASRKRNKNDDEHHRIEMLKKFLCAHPGEGENPQQQRADQSEDNDDDDDDADEEECDDEEEEEEKQTSVNHKKKPQSSGKIGRKRGARKLKF